MALTRLRIGRARFRVGSWQGAPDVAHVAPLTEAATLAPGVLASMRDQLRDRGYRAVVTAALAPRQRDCLLVDGFGVHSELVVMSRDLAAPIPAAAGRWRLSRRGRERDLASVLRVDAAAFPPGQRFGLDGLREARVATPHCRWRVCGGRQVKAYSIAGRAGPRGYLQRLAVLPACQQRGLGTLLVLDALRWLRRGGARSALVNTTPDNERAMALYRRCGFILESDRLTVLHRDLP